jgi:signal peptidase I
MEPTLMEGDLAIVRRADTYGRGDVVAFRVPQGEPAAGGLVIHRIVGGSRVDGFVMQGDNKPRPDSWRPRQTDLVGALWLVIPGAGPILTQLRNPAVFAAVAAAIAVFTIMIGAGGGRKRGALEQPKAMESPSVALPTSGEPAAVPSPGPYAWTLARGLAVCGASDSRAGRRPIGSPRRSSPDLPRSGGAAATSEVRQGGTLSESYRWTRARGLAVCKASRPWIHPLPMVSSAGRLADLPRCPVMAGIAVTGVKRS